MNFLNFLFGSKNSPTKIHTFNEMLEMSSFPEINSNNETTLEMESFLEINSGCDELNQLLDKNQINIEYDQLLKTNNLIKNIFTDNCTKPEKNNSIYVSEIMSIPNISEIVNKTYQTDKSLDEESKKIHEHLRKHKLYKITNSLESDHNYFYKTGLNKFHSTYQYSDKLDCIYGGLYFAKDKDILDLLDSGIYIREVFLCHDSKIVEKYNSDYNCSKYKTDKFILGARKLLNMDFLNSLMPDKYIKPYLSDKIVMKENHPLSSIFNKMQNLFTQTIPPSVDEVRECYFSLPEAKKPMFIILSSNAICRNSIQKHILNIIDDHNNNRNNYHLNNDQFSSSVYHAFEFMYKPSEDVKQLAVLLNPMCIEKIHNPSLEICKLAIDRYPKCMSNLMDRQICDELFTQLHTQCMFYDLHYIKYINDVNQEYLISQSPLFLMLLSDPVKSVLDICNNIEQTIQYVNMYNGSIEKYLLCDNFFEMKTRLFLSLSKYFNNKTQNFMDQLILYGGYISGSFACNAMYGTNYDCSDIDIYFNDYNSAINFGEALKDFEYLRTSCLKYNQYSILGTHIDRIITHKVISPHSIYMPKIQLIVINRKVNPINYIMTYFDIDHCKVVIDGNCNFYSYDKKSNNEIFVTNVSDHIINVFNLFQKSIELYKEKGNDEQHKYFKSLIVSMKAYIKKVYGRINKYKKRGVIFNEENISLFDSLVNSVKSHIVITIDNSNNLEDNSKNNLITEINNSNNIELVKNVENDENEKPIFFDISCKDDFMNFQENTNSNNDKTCTFLDIFSDVIITNEPKQKID